MAMCWEGRYASVALKPPSSGSCRIHDPERTTPRPKLYPSTCVKQDGAQTGAACPNPSRFGPVIASCLDFDSNEPVPTATAVVARSSMVVVWLAPIGVPH